LKQEVVKTKSVAMKNLFKVNYLILFIFLTTSINIIAQTTAKAGSVALIDSYMFQDEKAGIKKLLDLQNNLSNEFKPRREELESMQNKLTTLKKQLDQNTTANAARQKMVEEGENLERSLRQKSQDYDDQIKRRYQTLMSPVQQQIGAQIKTWCSQKGYIALIDVSKDNNGLILWMNDQEVASLTTELIKYLNTVL
jgi:Skp family chaperone for outer membrane proteins